MVSKTALLGPAVLCLVFMHVNQSSATDLALSFTAIQGGSNPSAQTVNVTNTGKGKLKWTASDDAAWLSVSPTSGTTRRTDVIRVMVNIAGLAANTYTATITLSTSGTTSTAQQIQVTLTVVAPSPSIGRSPTSLSFTAAQGGPNPTPQTFQITNPGLGTLSWSVTDDATWLSLSPSSGTTTTETETITVNVTTANLTQNTYRATVTVTDPKAVNSPQQIPVTLALTAPESYLAVVSWDPNTESDLAGYKVYVGTASRVYGVPVDVGTTTSFKVINLLKGQTYYFAITAYDTEGNESAYSNEVSKTIY